MNDAAIHRMMMSRRSLWKLIVSIAEGMTDADEGSPDSGGKLMGNTLVNVLITEGDTVSLVHVVF